MYMKTIQSILVSLKEDTLGVSVSKTEDVYFFILHRGKMGWQATDLQSLMVILLKM